MFLLVTKAPPPHTPYTAHNLSSALQHPDVITSELQKEVAAGRVLGPFADRPLPSIRTSGLGAAAKKQGKWRMILHLSAPYGASVNDGISKEEFSLHYSSVDDAVKLLHPYGKGAIMAKVDLKAAFRMVPVQYVPQTRTYWACSESGPIMSTLASPLGCDLPHAYLIILPRRCIGSW